MSTATSITAKLPSKFSTAIAAAAVIFGLAGSFGGIGAALAQSMPAACIRVNVSSSAEE